MTSKQTGFTQSLLSRAHSPDTANRILSDSINHRPLRLRATSPPTAKNNARANRRAARELAKKRRKIKPAPLSSRQRKRLGVYDVPPDRGCDLKSGTDDSASSPSTRPSAKQPPRKGNYAIFSDLHTLWLGYIHEILGNEIYEGGAAAAAKLSAADFHGAEVEIVRSGCVSRVGIKGIVIKDSKFVFEIITKDNRIKVVPKEGTIFRLRIPASLEVKRTTETNDLQRTKEDVDGGLSGVSNDAFVFELLGDQFRQRSADRASRKFKKHFLKSI